MNDKPFTDDLSSILTNSENLSDNEDIKNIKNILKDYGTDLILCKKCNSHILVQFINFDTFSNLYQNDYNQLGIYCGLIHLILNIVLNNNIF